MRRLRHALAALALLAIPCVLRGQLGPALVAVSPVVEREVVAEKQFVATVTPLRVSVVGSAVEGRVLEMSVDEGDRIEKGQPIAQLRTKTIEAELSSARAELNLRDQELIELENGSRPEEIAQAKAMMLADQARMEYAKKDLERIQRLYRESSAATDEYDEAVSKATETEQEYLEAAAAYELAVKGPRKERIEQARARRDQQQHEVDRLEDILSKYTVNAPFDGFITNKRTEVGEWVMQGQAIAEAVEIHHVDVEALVPEDSVNRLRIGMEAKVRVPSIPHQEFAGVVAKIVPQADTRSRSFPVKVRVENPMPQGQPALKSGQFAEVNLQVGDPKRVLLVSKDAIVLGGPTPLVYVFEPGDEENSGTVRPVPVVTGLSTGGMIEVTGQLAAGDKVVVRGNERLMPGQPVKVSETKEVPGETS